jgi:biotin carboxyl carrier protein
MKYNVTIAGRTRLLEILREVQPGRYSLLLDGRQHDLTLSRTKSGVDVHLGPTLYRAEVLDARRPRIARVAAAKGPFELTAMMPGKVVRVLVTEGQSVAAQQGIIVIEAMKMENELRVAHPGLVQSILVKPGQLVENGAPLVRFTSLPAEAPAQS